MKIASTITVAALIAAVTPALADVVVVNQAISKTEVLAAQKGWCQALVDISSTYANSGRAAIGARRKSDRFGLRLPDGCCSIQTPILWV